MGTCFRTSSSAQHLPSHHAGDEGNEGDEGHEGYEEGHEAPRDEGCRGGCTSDEGHEGYEGNEGYEEGHEAQGNEGRRGGRTSDEGDESHEGYEGHEGYEEGNEGHEGNESHEGDEEVAVGSACPCCWLAVDVNSANASSCGGVPRLALLYNRGVLRIFENSTAKSKCVCM